MKVIVSFSTSPSLRERYRIRGPSSLAKPASADQRCSKSARDKEHENESRRASKKEEATDFFLTISTFLFSASIFRRCCNETRSHSVKPVPQYSLLLCLSGDEG